MSERHQLVVLSLISGKGLESQPGREVGQIIVRGLLGEVWLASEGVEACGSPNFDHQQLVWELSVAQLRKCRSNKVMLRVEVWLDEVMMGHLVLDMRTAVPLNTKQDEAPVRSYRLIGLGASLQLSLALEEVDTIAHNISEEEMETAPQDRKAISQGAQYTTLSPVLISGEDGRGGYFLIGPQSLCHQKFSLSLCLVCAENLQLVAAKDSQVLQLDHPFYFHYSMLGVDISTEQFSSLDKPQFVSEKTTAMIISNQEYIGQFLSSAGVSIKLCQGATVLAAAELELCCVTPDESNGNAEDRMTYQGKIDMVSSHNLAVPEDTEGNRARIGVMVVLEREEMALSTGRLSESDMEADVDVSDNDNTYVNKNNSQNLVGDELSKQQLSKMTNKQTNSADPYHHEATTNTLDIRPPSPPTKLSQTPAESDPSISPTKLPISRHSPSPHLTPTQPPFTPPGDTTDYLSPPTALPPTRSYKLSIELKTIHLTAPTTSYNDTVLVYKYLALHKEVITTSTFSLMKDKTTAVPGGYCQFSFAVQEAKMKQTFGKHLLKIGLYVGGQKKGMASVDLTKVVGGGKWVGQVEFVGSEGLLGKLEVDLLLEQQQGNKVVKESGDQVQEENMLAMAARELETWKMEQKKQFNDSLVQVEVQHLTLLGKEWREREKERERVMQEKMETFKILEQELRLEIEKIEVERREMEERKRSVESELEKIEREKLAVKNEKLSIVERLKQQLKEKEAEVAVKNSEINVLTNRLGEATKETEKRKKDNCGESKKASELVAELAQLRAEKTNWKSSLEQLSKEKQFYMHNSEQLRVEVVQLQKEKENAYMEQIAGLEKHVSELLGQLMNKKEIVTETSAALLDPVKNVETQTPQVRSLSSESPDRKEEMVGLARLEENLAMLLRTGVYTETDHVVVKLTQQIEKLRDRLRGVGNKKRKQ